MESRFLTPKKLAIAGIILFFTIPIIILCIFVYSYVLDCISGYIYFPELFGTLDIAFRATTDVLESFASWELLIMLVGFVFILISIIWSSKNKYYKILQISSLIIAFLFFMIFVLAFINPARGKNADGAIKSNLNNTRAQAEVYYDEHGRSYGLSASSCDTAGSLFVDDSNIKKSIAGAEEASLNKAQCLSDGKSWAIAIPLRNLNKLDKGLFCRKDVIHRWCVDSTGNSKSITEPILSPTCP